MERQHPAPDKIMDRRGWISGQQRPASHRWGEQPHHVQSVADVFLRSGKPIQPECIAVEPAGIEPVLRDHYDSRLELRATDRAGEGAAYCISAIRLGECVPQDGCELELRIAYSVGGQAV